MPADQNVLALKWRPHNFNEMVGQEHILPALINSLDQERLHHAYLFTGTRGVGKTSVARILAKCMSCEKGISSKPCNICDTCVAIANGNYIDLIEVDAASRTKVEDTRELLDNVQYAPSQGRFKIYLIDEVHMLSGHSFNALLKTLEEPPAHVKFLFATTDPQKLPITVLSRCLQFHLKHIPQDLLVKHFEYILEEENIEFDIKSLSAISQAAKGSVRDGLSLLDQAIAFSGNKLNLEAVQSMLGHIAEDDIWMLLSALSDADPSALLSAVAQIGDYTSDFSQLLESLIETLHRIAVAQFVPEKSCDQTARFAKAFSKESVQLYYQIALGGRRDLPLAANPRSGIEMTLLRMLAFEPAEARKNFASNGALQATQNNQQILPEAPQDVSSNWTNIVDTLQLTGMTQVLASHCSVGSYEGNRLQLLLSNKHQPILNQKLEARLNDALSSYFGKAISLEIRVGEPNKTPATDHKIQQKAAQDNATHAMENDTHVQALVDVFDAELQPGSLNPVEAIKDTN